MSSSTTSSPITAREIEIDEWLQSVVGRPYRRVPASSDASFRRYFRIEFDNSTRILMDAPPRREDCRPFVHAQALLSKAGVNVPEIIDADLERGLLLLSDLGKCSYLDELDETNCDQLYGDALNTLESMQIRIQADAVPAYDDKKLEDELRLFPDWFLGRHLGIDDSCELFEAVEACFEPLISICLEQPRVFVHRDYHSRNLMRLNEANPGVLDFQDAVCGPVTYDLVSLFRDVYIAWPAPQIKSWVQKYFDQLGSRHDILSGVDPGQFLRWFDLTGVQRHLKVAGIFCRLWHRDGKPGYLRDIPLTLRYLMEIGAVYPETRSLVKVFNEFDLMSRLESANAAVRAGGKAGREP